MSVPPTDSGINEKKIGNLENNSEKEFSAIELQRSPKPNATIISQQNCEISDKQNENSDRSEGKESSEPKNKDLVASKETTDNSGLKDPADKTNDEINPKTGNEENSAQPKIENAENSANKSKFKNENEKKPKRTYDDGVLKTTAKVQEGVSNSKYDPSILPVTNDPEQIRAQVEFYFGDSNLPTDKYLWGLTGGSTNKPVPIKKICVFGRMKRFNSYTGIVSALRESQFLKVTGEEGEEMVERKVPYDPNLCKNHAESRFIYAKGFGDEEPSSQFDIEAFFASYGPINVVRLRRTPEKLFKGSVFVEFADEDTAQKFLNLPTKPLWKGEHELKIMSKKAYTDLKEEEFKSGKARKTRNKLRSQGKDKGKDRGKFRGNQDLDDWKKRRDQDQASGFKNDRNHKFGKKGTRNQRQEPY